MCVLRFVDLSVIQLTDGGLLDTEFLETHHCFHYLSIKHQKMMKMFVMTSAAGEYSLPEEDQLFLETQFSGKLFITNSSNSQYVI